MPSRRAITATTSMVTVASTPTIRPTMNARLSIVRHLRPYWLGCRPNETEMATAGCHGKHTEWSPREAVRHRWESRRPNEREGMSQLAQQWGRGLHRMFRAILA